jgi:hypothetical protein
MGRRGRRRQKLRDDVEEKREYCKLKEEDTRWQALCGEPALEETRDL